MSHSDFAAGVLRACRDAGMSALATGVHLQLCRVKVAGETYKAPQRPAAAVVAPVIKPAVTVKPAAPLVAGKPPAQPQIGTFDPQALHRGNNSIGTSVNRFFQDVGGSIIGYAPEQPSSRRLPISTLPHKPAPAAAYVHDFRWGLQDSQDAYTGKIPRTAAEAAEADRTATPVTAAEAAARYGHLAAGDTASRDWQDSAIWAMQNDERLFNYSSGQPDFESGPVSAAGAAAQRDWYHSKWRDNAQEIARDRLSINDAAAKWTRQDFAKPPAAIPGLEQYATNYGVPLQDKNFLRWWAAEGPLGSQGGDSQDGPMQRVRRYAGEIKSQNQIVTNKSINASNIGADRRFIADRYPFMHAPTQDALELGGRVYNQSQKATNYAIAGDASIAELAREATYDSHPDARRTDGGMLNQQQINARERAAEPSVLGELGRRSGRVGWGMLNTVAGGVGTGLGTLGIVGTAAGGSEHWNEYARAFTDSAAEQAAAGAADIQNTYGMQTAPGDAGHTGDFGSWLGNELPDGQPRPLDERLRQNSRRLLDLNRDFFGASADRQRNLLQTVENVGEQAIGAAMTQRLLTGAITAAGKAVGSAKSFVDAAGNTVKPSGLGTFSRFARIRARQAGQPTRVAAREALRQSRNELIGPAAPSVAPVTSTGLLHMTVPDATRHVWGGAKNLLSDTSTVLQPNLARLASRAGQAVADTGKLLTSTPAYSGWKALQGVSGAARAGLQASRFGLSFAEYDSRINSMQDAVAPLLNAVPGIGPALSDLNKSITRIAAPVTNWTSNATDGLAGGLPMQLQLAGLLLGKSLPAARSWLTASPTVAAATTPSVTLSRDWAIQPNWSSISNFSNLPDVVQNAMRPPVDLRDNPQAVKQYEATVAGFKTHVVDRLSTMAPEELQGAANTLISAQLALANARGEDPKQMMLRVAGGQLTVDDTTTAAKNVGIGTEQQGDIGGSVLDGTGQQGSGTGNQQGDTSVLDGIGDLFPEFSQHFQSLDPQSQMLMILGVPLAMIGVLGGGAPLAAIGGLLGFVGWHGGKVPGETPGVTDANEQQQATAAGAADDAIPTATQPPKSFEGALSQIDPGNKVSLATAWSHWKNPAWQDDATRPQRVAAMRTTLHKALGATRSSWGLAPANYIYGALDNPDSDNATTVAGALGVPNTPAAMAEARKLLRDIGLPSS